MRKRGRCGQRRPGRVRSRAKISQAPPRFYRGSLGTRLEYYDDDDDTKFVNSRLTVFSCGELTAGMNLLGKCIARDGQKRCCWRVLKA